MKLFCSLIICLAHLCSLLYGQELDLKKEKTRYEKLVVDSLVSVELPKPVSKNSNPYLSQWEEISYRALGEFCNVSFIKRRKPGLNYQGDFTDSLYHVLLDKEYDSYIASWEQVTGAKTLENVRVDVDGFEGRFFKIKENTGMIHDYIIVNIRSKVFQLKVSYQPRFASDVETEKNYIFNSFNVLN